MTRGRLVLAAVVGMLLTGVIVYVATPPRTVEAPAASGSTAPPALDAAAERDELAELRREVERLQALLDAGEELAAAEDDAEPEGGADDAAPEPADDGQPGPVAPVARRAEPGAVVGGCLKPVSAELFNRMVVEVAALRQLPPDRFEEVRRAMLEGSDRCTCTPDPAGVTRCVEWCVAKGFVSGGCDREACVCRI